MLPFRVYLRFLVLLIISELIYIDPFRIFVFSTEFINSHEIIFGIIKFWFGLGAYKIALAEHFKSETEKTPIKKDAKSEIIKMLFVPFAPLVKFKVKAE